MPQECQVVKNRILAPKSFWPTVLPHPPRVHKCIHKARLLFMKNTLFYVKIDHTHASSKKRPFILIFVSYPHSNFLWSHNSWIFFFLPSLIRSPSPTSTNSQLFILAWYESLNSQVHLSLLFIQCLGSKT